MRTLIIKLLRFYTLYFPIRFGKVPLLRLFSALGLFNNVELTAEFEKGLKAKFFVSDWVQQLVYFFGTYIYEKHEVRHWKNYAASSKRILDIGSNFGFYSLVAANVNRNAEIFAFEPSPAMFTRIKDNIGLNNFNNISVVQKGVSDKIGEFEFFVSEDSNTGMSSLSRRDNSKVDSIRIEVVDIDSFVLQNKLDSVDLVKIDVEGNEFNVLKGMHSTIEKNKPSIFVELYGENLSNFGHSVEDVMRFMAERGYQCYECDENGSLKIVPVAKDLALAIFMV